MNELEIRKIAKEEFISNVMNNLDSTLIFTYIQNLEQKVNNLQSKIGKAIEWIEQYEKQIGTLGETSKSIVLTDDVVIGNLLDILKEVE